MKKIILTAIAITLISITGFSQTLNKKTLCKKWHLDKYIIDSKEYVPEKKEKDDYIYFNIDGTYKAVSEGTLEQGIWGLNLNGDYILLKNDKENILKVYVVSIFSEVLILRYDIQEIRDIELRYKAKL